MKVLISCGDAYGTGYLRGILLKRQFDLLGCSVVFTYTLPIYDAADGFDVVYIVRPPLEMFSELSRWHELKRLGVPIVVDGDDAFWDVPENHPSSGALNRRDVRRAMAAVFQMADVLTTTTEYAAQYFKPYIRDGVPVCIIPNAFDPDYKMYRPFHGHNAMKREGHSLIGWMGGTQHRWDLERLMPVWKALSERGDSSMFLGDLPPSIIGLPFTHSAPGSPLAEYYLQTPALLQFDVGLGPLENTVFNAVKSPLKIIEYRWLAGIPCVMSDLPCFDEIPADGKWVFKVKGFDRDEWISTIDLALKTIPLYGRSYVLPSRYNIKNTIRSWYDAFLAAYRLVKQKEPEGQYPSFHETKKDIHVDAVQIAGEAAARLMGRA